LQLIFFEQYDEAARHYEELVRRGTTNPISFSNLAVAYRAMGDTAKSVAAIDVYAKRNPENGAGHLSLATALIGDGRYDDALPELARAELLDPTNPNVLLSRSTVQILREDWSAATAAADALYASADETRRFNGAALRAIIAGFAGRCAEAIDWATRATEAYRTPGLASVNARRLAATMLGECGRPAAGLAQAQRALAEIKGRGGERGILSDLAIASASAGRQQEADTMLRGLEAPTLPLRATIDARELAHARGAVALARRDFSTAVAELQKAQGALTPRTGNPNGGSPHVRIWSLLGEALIGAGRPSDAEPWFQKIATSGLEHARQPLPYVRSFYQLGTIYEKAGDAAKAREAYRRFVGYWRDGDLDRARVAEAQQKIAALR
jgi:tetratricopeptide (TPR) repeat protein